MIFAFLNILNSIWSFSNGFFVVAIVTHFRFVAVVSCYKTEWIVWLQKAAFTEAKEGETAVTDAARLEELKELAAKKELSKIKKEFLEGEVI